MKREYIYIILSLVIGFLLGRAMTKPIERIEYIKGETITKEVPKYLLSPLSKTAHSIEYLPMVYFFTDTISVNDTITGNIVYIPDTAKVFDDFLTLKEYDFVLMETEYGTVNFQGEVQFNALQRAGGSLTPIQKVITSDRKKRLLPFISGSYHTVSGVGVGGGLFYYNLGLQYYHYQDNTSMLAISYKF